MKPEEMAHYSAYFYKMIHQAFETKNADKAMRLFSERARLFEVLPPGRLLDVGSERGFFIEVMKRRGWNGEGVEPHKPFADEAVRKFGHIIHYDTLEDAKLEGKYDLITLWHVLEHTDNPVHALMKCARLLSRRGVLFFEVPNIDSLGAILAGAYWMAFRDPTHRWFFRDRSLALMSSTAGLSLERVGPAGSPAGWYGLKRGLQGRIRMQDYWESKMNAELPRPSAWRRALAAVVSFYPFMKSASWLGDVSGRGEVLHGWCKLAVA